MARITFNGQEYDSPDAMPPDVRQLYDLMSGMLADQDGDGMPDMFEGMAGNNASITTQTTQFVVDGKVYTNLDQMPPEARQRYEQTMRRFDADGDGVFDILASVSSGAAPAAPAAQAPPASQTPHVTVVGEGSGLSPAWLVAIFLILLLGAAVLYLLLSR
jgi:hypothetical protein